MTIIALTTAAAAPALMPTTSAAQPPTKSAAVIKLLGRARGATVAEMQAATSWQPHSVRAYLSGPRKAGRTLGKEERKSGETSYRLVAEPAVRPDAIPANEVLLEDPAAGAGVSA